jgi:hypothetical protein
MPDSISAFGGEAVDRDDPENLPLPRRANHL